MHWKLAPIHCLVTIFCGSTFWTLRSWYLWIDKFCMQNEINAMAEIVVWPHDSTASSAICYVYLIRRHEAVYILHIFVYTAFTYSSVWLFPTVYMCVKWLSFCTKTSIVYTQTERRKEQNEWKEKQLAPIHMPIVSHWIIHQCWKIAFFSSFSSSLLWAYHHLA